MISRGARAGYALIEGILPDKERKVSDLLSSVTMGSVAPLEPKAREENSALPAYFDWP